MDSGKTFDSIPNDLLLKIFSRLPTKSVGMCRCVLKLWASILYSQDFTELFLTELFLTKSSPRPRLLFVVARESEYFFYSSPQSQNPSLVVDFQTKFYVGISQYMCSYASGLIYVPVPNFWISKASVCVICNPATGQYVSLPELDNKKWSQSFLGFDPVGKQYKVLTFMNRNLEWVLTLGTGKMRWRKIQCPLTHDPSCQAICINGVLYYLARTVNVPSCQLLLVCFDVRSEKFKFIDVTSLFYPYTELINYKGKLGGTNLKYDDDGVYPSELRVLVLEDIEKEEWSKYVYSLPKIHFSHKNISVVGMTAIGEIVFSDNYTCKPFYVYYFNPERNTLQSVEIQGFGGNLNSRVYAFVDYIEDLSVNDSKQPESIQQQRLLTSPELCNSAPSNLE